MRKLERDIEEIEKFIGDWSPASPDLSNKEIRAKVKSSYKQFHALLVWGMALELPPVVDRQVKIYFTEALSDLSHAYFLNICSLYKSSRSSLRSSIENVIRVMLLVKGVDVSRITSVFDMFARAKLEYWSDAVVLSAVNKLHGVYGELCKSVHSAVVDYMSLVVPFSDLSEYDGVAFLDENEKLRVVSSLINQIAFWHWSDRLSACGHVNSDLVLDAVPKGIKRAKMNDGFAV